MTRIGKNSDFVNTLAALSLEQQRDVGVKFIADVLHLASNTRLQHAYDLLAKPGRLEHDLKLAHSIAHSVYVETSPWSDISELEFNCQATNFIAQAMLVCSAPAKPGATKVNLAQKVSNYCRMAHTCSNIGHGEDGPDFSKAEVESKEIIKTQFAILEGFLASLDP
jgi:hypothetical protein